MGRGGSGNRDLSQEERGTLLLGPAVWRGQSSGPEDVAPSGWPRRGALVPAKPPENHVVPGDLLPGPRGCLPRAASRWPFHQACS